MKPRIDLIDYKSAVTKSADKPDSAVTGKCQRVFTEVTLSCSQLNSIPGPGSGIFKYRPATQPPLGSLFLTFHVNSSFVYFLTI
jgi:hypothetical protein